MAHSLTGVENGGRFLSARKRQSRYKTYSYGYIMQGKTAFCQVWERKVDKFVVASYSTVSVKDTWADVRVRS